MYKIIDIHTHVYPEAISDKAVKSLAAFYEFTVEGKGTYTEGPLVRADEEICSVVPL